MTRFWEELQKNKGKVYMLNNGDQVKDIISLSDLMLAKLEQDLKERNITVGKKELENYFKKYGFETRTEYLGNSMLALITPIKNRFIPIHKITKKPSYLIIKPITQNIGKKELIDSPKGIKLQ